ncbi:MAG TPA: hypothetical protein VN936_02250 [Candidatus Acidoferrum sp.]|nr:hypothetical protein [Candidatus Acidoferrum sp.]
MNAGVLLEAALLSPVLQSAFGNADPFGQLGATLMAESLARRDDAFARLVERAVGGTS